MDQSPTAMPSDFALSSIISGYVERSQVFAIAAKHIRMKASACAIACTLMAVVFMVAINQRVAQAAPCAKGKEKAGKLSERPKAERGDWVQIQSAASDKVVKNRRND